MLINEQTALLALLGHRVTEVEDVANFDSFNVLHVGGINLYSVVVVEIVGAGFHLSARVLEVPGRLTLRTDNGTQNHVAKLGMWKLAVD